MHARKNRHLSISSPGSSALPPSSALTPRTPRTARGDPFADALPLSRSLPPSPGLPPTYPSKTSRSAAACSRMVRSLVVPLCTIAVLAWLAVRLRRHPAVAYDVPDEPKYEMVGSRLLPDEPSVVAMVDENGRGRWSVSVPADSQFPLAPGQYEDLCDQATEVSNSIHAKAARRPRSGYYHTDPAYVDVQDAVDQGLLPDPNRSGAMVSAVGWDHAHDASNTDTCDTSLTFVMDTADAGLGKTLMGLWMAYGLARLEGRAFFVDDTRWPYGNYTSYFKPPPTPPCRPPMASHAVPCPHQARHLVVCAATVRTAFGHAFVQEYEDPRRTLAHRQYRIFGMLRDGYEALFHLRDDDASYVQQRTRSLYGPVADQRGISIGMHVRRGDRHPFEYQYSKDYIPLHRFMQSVHDLIVGHHGASLSENSTDGDVFALTASQAVLASDDPDVYTAAEMAGVVRAQDRIVLASKTTLEASGARNRNRYIDEISGWEGGFFHNVFWSLGRPNANNAAAATAVTGSEPDESALRMRELVGRAYLLDLAVVAQADRVLCTISATGCRLLAVMMGWGRAIEQGAWMNVDGEGHWTGVDW